MSALNPIFYQLVTTSLWLIAEVLGLGLFGELCRLSNRLLAHLRATATGISKHFVPRRRRFLHSLVVLLQQRVLFFFVP